MTEIRYQDSEADGSSYVTRYLVTDRYLRMDEGRDDADFTLLDRKTRKIVNVVHDSKLIIALPDRKLPKAPPLAYEVEKKVTQVREGTVRVQVLVDGKVCSETVAVSKLYPDAVRALSEYKKSIAYTQWTTYQTTPSELRQVCDLVQHVWQADYALSKGFPIEERDYSGRVRQYLDGSKIRLKSELFKLPGNYAVFQLPESNGEGEGNSSQPSAVQTR